jgi:hypothetical protein
MKKLKRSPAGRLAVAASDDVGTGPAVLDGDDVFALNGKTLAGYYLIASEWQDFGRLVSRCKSSAVTSHDLCCDGSLQDCGFMRMIIEDAVSEVAFELLSQTQA